MTPTSQFTRRFTARLIGGVRERNIMKTTAILIVFMMSVFAVEALPGERVTLVHVTLKSGAINYSINSRAVDRPIFEKLITKLASFDTNQSIAVVADNKLTVSQLMPILLYINNSGLHSTIISAPSQVNGIEGQITLYCELSAKTNNVDENKGPGGFETNETVFIQYLRYDRRPWERP